MEKKAVVLLSGGMDSAVVLFTAAAGGYAAYALTLDYGQKNFFEIECAKKLAERAGVRSHKIMTIDLGAFGGSALTSGGRLSCAGEVPDTYVPGRNTVFLSLALSWAEAEGADVVFYGANTVDYSGYPDCTKEYVRAFNNLARAGFAVPVRIEAPLLDMSKKEIVKKGISLGVDFSMTSSCYFPDETGAHCRRCPSCIIRFKALQGGKE